MLERWFGKAPLVSLVHAAAAAAAAASAAAAAGDPPLAVPARAQCEDPAPPAPALAIGATSLVFCDDFSKDTIARGSTEAARDITEHKKWSTERPGFYSGYQPATDFTLDTDAGVVTIAPSENKAQSAMQSIVTRSGRVRGFYIDRFQRGFYVEARIKMEKYAASPKPAIWTMDLCHWLSWPQPCSEQSASNDHLEIDWFEYNNARTTVHRWREQRPGRAGVMTPWLPQGHSERHSQCGAGNNLAAPLRTWVVYGWRATATKAEFFTNDVESREFTQETCPGVPFHLQTKGRFPLLIGAQVGDVIAVDYVRVWRVP
jgi:hypothetical protein